MGSKAKKESRRRTDGIRNDWIVIDAQPRGNQPRSNELNLVATRNTDLDLDGRNELNNSLLQDPGSGENDRRITDDNSIENGAMNDAMIRTDSDDQIRTDSNVLNVNPDNPLNFRPQRRPKEEWDERALEAHHTARKKGTTRGRIPDLFIANYVCQAWKGIRSTRLLWNTQESRHHNAVPGREGETFQSNPGEGDILDDFRRVPTVWSRVTAAKATVGEGEHERDVPPKLSVYVAQPEPYTRETPPLNSGHSTLGIEYTGRRSRYTGKKERYLIQCGFYPAGGMGALSEVVARGAVVPGMLKNDSDKFRYHISKTYTVSRQKAADVAEAAEKYTENGGYGLYTRNCTTFVRDMFRVGGIPDLTVDTIFTNEMVRFDALRNEVMSLVTANWGSLDMKAKDKLGDIRTKADVSYQGWGNRRATKEEIRRYDETKNSIHGKIITALTPADAGENIRNMTDVAGQLGSYTEAERKKNVFDSQVINKINGRGSELRACIMGHVDDIGLLQHAGELTEWYNRLEKIADPFDKLYEDALKAGAAGKPVAAVITQERVKDAYAGLSENMAMVSKCYQKYFFSDSRMQKTVMRLLSAMQEGLDFLDSVYREIKVVSNEGELGRLRTNMITKGYTVKVGNIVVKMTPSHYESYLQIYKTPDAAVRAYHRYQELEEKMKYVGFNKREKAEFIKLKTAEDLASDLDKSHRDMLNKDGFTQSDIDYAFRLRKQENTSSKDAASGTMFSEQASASMTYINLMYDRIFGGIQAAIELDEEEEDTANAEWLNKYLYSKADAKRGGILMILRGIKHVLSSPSQASMKKVFHGFLKDHYLKMVLPTDESRGEAIQTVGLRREVYYDSICDRPMRFAKLIDELVNSVLNEREGNNRR